MKTQSKLALAMSAILLPAFVLAGCTEGPGAPNPQVPAPTSSTQMQNTPEAYGYTVLFNRNGCEFGRFTRPGYEFNNSSTEGQIFTVICPGSTNSAENASNAARPITTTIAPATESCGKSCTRDVTRTVTQTQAPKFN